MTWTLTNQRRRGLSYYLLLLLIVGPICDVVHCQKNYTYSELLPCELNTVQLTALGPDTNVEPCIVAEVYPFQTIGVDQNKTSVISLVQVTPTNCGNNRDGPVTGVQKLNSDNGTNNQK